MDYGDYGDYRSDFQPRNGYGNGYGNGSSVHYARFLSSRRMGVEEPSPQQVLNEVRKVYQEYKFSRNKPRKYSISVTPSEVLIREIESYHDEVIQTKYIHYCVHDEDYPNIFAFVAWSQSQSNFLAHIFCCRDVAEAENLKAAFANGFKAAYRDYKSDARGPPRRARPEPRDTYSEYAPARLTRGALDHHRRSYESPAVMEREHYRPPARVTSGRQRPRGQKPRPDQLIEVYGSPHRGYDYYDDEDDDVLAEVPPPRQAAPVEKEVVYTRETFPPPNFGHESFDRRRGGYDDGMYASRGGGGGIYGGRQSRRYADNKYARDDMLF